MNLLFDQNLSHHLVDELKTVFRDSSHVRDVGLAASSDQEVWNFAAANQLMILSKDIDFEQRALLRGPPPTVIWVRLGNCSTADVARRLRTYSADIGQFEADSASAFLALS